MLGVLFLRQAPWEPLGMETIWQMTFHSVQAITTQQSRSKPCYNVQEHYFGAQRLLFHFIATRGKMEIRRAEMNDLEGIITLHKQYHVNSISLDDKPDGFVTTNFTPEQLQALIEKERGVTIATEGDKVISYAMAASWQFWSEWPLFIHMIAKLPEHSFNGQVLTIENSYQYGPICVDKAYRSTGVFEAIFYASLASMMHRFPVMVTFINKINPRSYAAHTRKVKMDTVCTFQFNNNDYYMLACPTNQKPA